MQSCFAGPVKGRAATALLLTVAAVGVSASTPVDAGPRHFVRLSRLAPRHVPSGAKAVGSVAPGRSVRLDIALAPSDPARIGLLLRDLYDPSSARYHRWLKPGEFTADFGPAPAEVAAVAGWLRGMGASGVRVSGFDVGALVPAGELTSTMAISLQRYRLRSGRTGWRPSRAPKLPAGLAGGVSAIIGLDTLSRPATRAAASHPDRRTRSKAAVQPAGRIDGLTACHAAQSVANKGYYTFNELGSKYGIGSLLSDAQYGRGETIGLYELAAHSASDVQAYKSCFGLTNPVSTVGVDGGASPTSSVLEADGDIEDVATQAPGASVVSYEGPRTAIGAYDTWNAIVSADAAQVVSTSWGECEPDAVASGDIPAYTPLFEQAAAQGQTILVASGDGGTEGCFQAHGTTGAEVDYPASDPWVTAVGGTALYAAGDEPAWNYCQRHESVSCADSYVGQAAGGGGLSRYEPRPYFQPKVLYWPLGAEPCGTYCREVPDISANSGVYMVAFIGGRWSLIAGTSFAAPLVAGLVADKNTGCTTSTGVWTPALYALAAQGVYGTALRDITKGNIDMTGSHGGRYAATRSYDPATGLGAPLAGGLSCPEVPLIKPSAGPGGSMVTLYGRGLERATISFGSKHATVLSRTATSATVKVPPGTGTVPVSAKDVAGSGTQTATFTYGPARADLALNTSARSTVRRGSKFKVHLTVTNIGPHPADTVVTTLTLPRGIRLVERGRARHGRHWYWIQRALTPGNNLRYTATLLDTRRGHTTVYLKTRTSSKTRDPNRGNNAESRRVHLR